MKRTLLVVFVILVGTAALAGAGFVGFQIGVHSAAAFQPDKDKSFKQNHRFGKDGMPMDEFHQFGGPRFEHRIGPGRIHHIGRGFGFIAPVFFLVKIIALGLVVWIIYNLFKGNGWQLTLARVQPTMESEKPTPSEKPKKGKQ